MNLTPTPQPTSGPKSQADQGHDAGPGAPAAAATAALCARGLTLGYGPQAVLHGVDLTVGFGEIRVVLGGSGCGKSTLMRHLIGLMAPQAGSIHLLGCDLARTAGPGRDMLLQRIGVLFQSGALLGSMTALENVALPLREHTQYPQDLVEEVARIKLALVGLEKASHLRPGQLSGGMRKRVALARAMALDPEILFCDEPSAGLDPNSAADLDKLLLNLRQQFGTTLIVVTHELASIHAIADRVLMLEGGRVVADGALTEVMNMRRPIIERFFSRASTVAFGVDAGLEQSLWRALGGKGE